MSRTSHKLFGELRTALRGALRYERGQRIDVRVKAIPTPATSKRSSHNGKNRVLLHRSQH